MPCEKCASCTNLSCHQQCLHFSNCMFFLLGYGNRSFSATINWHVCVFYSCFLKSGAYSTHNPTYPLSDITGAIYQITCSLFWSHKRLYITIFTYAEVLPKTCKCKLSQLHFKSQKPKFLSSFMYIYHIVHNKYIMTLPAVGGCSKYVKSDHSVHRHVLLYCECFYFLKMRQEVFEILYNALRIVVRPSWMLQHGELLKTKAYV